MAKLINGATINGYVPKMLETADSFIINAQLHDKLTLEPVKFQTVPVNSNYAEAYMDMHVEPYVNADSEHDSGTVVVDKYDPQYSYTIFSDAYGRIACYKFKNEDGNIKVENNKFSQQGTGSRVSIFSQDVNYIYGKMTRNAQTFIFRIAKSTCEFEFCNIGSTYSCLTLIKDTPLFIYYSYSRDNDKFCIGKYNKSNNSNTEIFHDNGLNASSYYTFSRPMVINENEILILRCNKTFVKDSVDTMMLKKYLIDYTYDKVYSKNINLDCSLLPKGALMRVNSSNTWNESFVFSVGDNMYFSLWNKANKKLYAVKRISDSSYSIIQEYDLPYDYNGVMPYNDGKTLIFFNQTSVDFISFKAYEERFEQTSSYSGNFKSLCIDRNKIIWLQHGDHSMEMLGLNVPTSAEALFVDTELEYKNEDIDTYIEVFCKNFDGNLVETNVDVMLSGPVKFSDTDSRKKKIKTSANTVTRVPVTITNSGFVEANAFLL